MRSKVSWPILSHGSIRTVPWASSLFLILLMLKFYVLYLFCIFDLDLFIFYMSYVSKIIFLIHTHTYIDNAHISLYLLYTFPCLWFIYFPIFVTKKWEIIEYFNFTWIRREKRSIDLGIEIFEEKLKKLLDIMGKLRFLNPFIHLIIKGN